MLENCLQVLSVYTRGSLGMALVHLNASEMGERISWLRFQAGWRKARDLARAMEEKDLGIFTKLDQGQSITPARLTLIAQLCTGRGNVVDDLNIVLGFLHGLRDEADVLRPRPRLVKGGDQPDSVDSLDSKGGSTGPKPGRIAA